MPIWNFSKFNFKKFLSLGISWVVLNSSSGTFAKESGGSSSKAAIGVEAGYHPRAQVWVSGKKDQASYLFKGNSWQIYMSNHDAKPGGVSLVLPTIAIWGDVLTSNYSSKDPSGVTAKETIKTQGIGAGYIGRDPSTGIASSLMIGVERAYLNQTGDTPRAQKYPYGFSSRVGLGWAPINGPLALDCRVDWVFKHFPSAKSKNDSLKIMQQQSFLPMIGISYNR